MILLKQIICFMSSLRQLRFNSMIIFFMKMTIQIVKDSEGFIYLKCATKPLPDAIGRLEDQKVILYLKNGELYTFSYEFDEEEFELSNDDPSIRIDYTGEVYHEMIICTGRLGKKLLMNKYFTDLVNSIFEDQDKKIQYKNFNLNKCKNLDFKTIYKIAGRYCRIDDVHFYSVGEYYECMSIKYLDHYIHYVMYHDDHFHLVNYDAVLTKKHMYNASYCKQLTSECDLPLSYFTAYGSTCKSSRKC